MSRADYIDVLREEIAGYREMLEPLEAGKIFIGERKSNQPEFVDRTQAQIDHLKHTIEVPQGIVDRHDAAVREGKRR
jgi:hypothetical protein